MSIYRQFLFELRYIPHILHLVTDFKQKSSRQFRSTAYLVFSTPAEARTLDTLIKSQVLYQLSYGSIVLWLQKYNLFPYHGQFSTTFFLFVL